MAVAAQPRRAEESAPQDATGMRKALVVGINGYSSSPLRCCVNDATDVHAALQRMGFESNLVLNCDLDDFLLATREFVNSLLPGEIGFFYFAGHGTEASILQAGRYNASNWLIALKMPEHRDDLPRFAVDAHNLLAEMEARKTRFNALVLDCCRDDRLPTGDRSLGRGLTSMDPKGSLVAFGCAQGQTTAERRTGRNGIFTEHLLKHIETPGLEINALFIRVGNAVERATRGLPQPMVPYVHHSLRCEGATLFPTATEAGVASLSAAATVEQQMAQVQAQLALESRLHELEASRSLVKAKESEALAAAVKAGHVRLEDLGTASPTARRLSMQPILAALLSISGATPAASLSSVELSSSSSSQSGASAAACLMTITMEGSLSGPPPFDREKFKKRLASWLDMTPEQLKVKTVSHGGRRQHEVQTSPSFSIRVDVDEEGYLRYESSRDESSSSEDASDVSGLSASSRRAAEDEIKGAIVGALRRQRTAAEAIEVLWTEEGSIIVCVKLDLPYALQLVDLYMRSDSNLKDEMRVLGVSLVTASQVDEETCTRAPRPFRHSSPMVATNNYSRMQVGSQVILKTGKSPRMRGGDPALVGKRATIVNGIEGAATLTVEVQGMLESPITLYSGVDNLRIALSPRSEVLANVQAVREAMRALDASLEPFDAARNYPHVDEIQRLWEGLRRWVEWRR